MLSDKWSNEADVSKIFILTGIKRRDVIDGLFCAVWFVKLSLSKQSLTRGRRSPEGFSRLQVQAAPRQPNSSLAHDFHEAFNVEEIPTATATASVLCICPALVRPTLL
jgi:hypothetical protein